MKDWPNLLEIFSFGISNIHNIRALTSWLCFDSWVHLMTFMLDSFNPAGLDTG